jgi:hypothetical protein
VWCQVRSGLAQGFLIEVEFEKDDVVVIPDYLKNLPGFREVTNDPQYFNCNLV